MIRQRLPQQLCGAALAFQAHIAQRDIFPSLAVLSLLAAILHRQQYIPIL